MMADHQADRAIIDEFVSKFLSSVIEMTEERAKLIAASSLYLNDDGKKFVTINMQPENEHTYFTLDLAKAGKSFDLLHLMQFGSFQRDSDKVCLPRPHFRCGGIYKGLVMLVDVFAEMVGEV
jgi:hypothetical protein